MRVLVTGSSGHLGEGLVRTLRARGDEVRGLDLIEAPGTTTVGSLRDAELVRECARGVDVILHAATLHKPHIATHTRRAFVETNVAGTLNVLAAARECGVGAVVFTSSTSAFGSALRPAPDQPAAWIDESVESVPRNIYGVTKRAAEDLCELFWRSRGLPCVVLRTSRFFPEADDDRERRARYADSNLKVNELLYRRVDLADAVDAHVLAAERAPELGFARYVVSATSPFAPAHLADLRTDPARVVRELYPDQPALYAERDWQMLATIDRVYVNRRAREELGWAPRHDFAHALGCLRRDEDPFSPLTRDVGVKGYHAESFADGPYPTEPERLGSDS